jgi:phage baseplate assembly protein W
MNYSFYKIPLELSSALAGNELPTCDLITSISKNVELIIMTKFGEHRSNPTFGCEIWDLDFEIIISEKLWEEKLRQSLLKSITTHENRLSDVKLSVDITEIEKYSSIRQFAEIKKRVNINLAGLIIKTGEAFNFSTNLFLSPLSVA